MANQDQQRNNQQPKTFVPDCQIDSAREADLQCLLAEVNEAARVLLSSCDSDAFQKFLMAIGPMVDLRELFTAIINSDQKDPLSMVVIGQWDKQESEGCNQQSCDDHAFIQISESVWECLNRGRIVACSVGACRVIRPGGVDVESLDGAYLVPLKSAFGLTGVLGYRTGQLAQDPVRRDKQFLQALACHLSLAVERYRKEQEFQRALKEKDVLLREVHHRVKNNMQIISSLLSLQARRIGTSEAIKAISESQNRIHAMSLIHEMLYQSLDLAAINADDYLNRLVRSLASLFQKSGQDITWQVRCSGVILSIDDAIPVGLIVNELVTNAFVHAFTGVSRGALVVELVEVESGHLALAIHDDGLGLAPEIDFENAETMGLQMVHDLGCGQLAGEISVLCDQGTEVCLTFMPAGQGNN